MEKFQDYVWNVAVTTTIIILILGFGTVNSFPNAQLVFARFDLMFNRGLSAWNEDIQLRTPVASPAAASIQQNPNVDWNSRQIWSNDSAVMLDSFEPSWPRGFLVIAGAISLSLLVMLNTGFWFMKFGAGFIDREKHYVLSQSK